MIFRTLLLSATLVMAGLTTASAQQNSGRHGRGEMIPTRTVTWQTTIATARGASTATSMPTPNRPIMAVTYPDMSSKYRIGDKVWFPQSNSVWEDLNDFFNPPPPGYYYMRDNNQVFLVDKNHRVVDIFRKK